MTDKQLKRKEQELQEAMDNYVQLDLQRVKEYNELVDLYKAKEQECEELREFQKLLEEQMKFNKSELELSLSTEIKRSEFLLKEFKKADKQKDSWREKAQKLKAENKQAEQKLKRIEEHCKEQNLKADYTACEILQIIDEVE